MHLFHTSWDPRRCPEFQGTVVDYNSLCYMYSGGPLVNKIKLQCIMLCYMYSGGPLLNNIKLQCIRHMYSDGPPGGGRGAAPRVATPYRSEEHTSELQS